MNILVLFGSSSDEYVYKPLCESLDGHEVMMEVISAHRNPDELEARLIKDDYDIVLAGAGLAAHLPGVVASKISKPVIGIPVPAQLEGIDALLSIIQMPFGVPVLTVGANNELLVQKYINTISAATISKPLNKINIVCREKFSKDEYVQNELKRFKLYAKENKVMVTNSELPSENELNIVYVVEDSDVVKDSAVPAIHVPIFSTQQKEDARECLRIHEWSKTGGLWVGINNSRNALKSLFKWC